MDLDLCVFKGYLGSKPFLRKTNDGQSVVNIWMALNKDWYSSADDRWIEKTVWVRLVFWGYQAEKLIKKKIYNGAYLFIRSSIDESKIIDMEGKEQTVITFKVGSFDLLVPEHQVNKVLQKAWEDQMIDHYAESFPAGNGQDDQTPPT